MVALIIIGLEKVYTCESSWEKMASNANIFGAATPTLLSSGAVAPPQVAGSYNVTCFLRLSKLKKELLWEDDAVGGVDVDGLFDMPEWDVLWEESEDVVGADTRSITLTWNNKQP